MERLLRFNSSEDHFEKVIKADSSFKDSFYQFALLQSYRKNYFKAVELANHQLRINNSLDNVLTGIFRLYDLMLTGENDDDISSYLTLHNSVYDRYALGEFYRRNDSLYKAEPIFDSLLSKHKGISLTAVYLSLVRLYVQKKEYRKASHTYWSAVNSLNSDVDADIIMKDFDYIINDREYRYLQTLHSTDDYKKALRLFWLDRNPLPSMPYNMRLIEHYQRLIYAEKYYRYDGFRLPIFDANYKYDLIKHPPWYYLNEKFNDRGVIYIRYGEPNDKITTVTTDGASYMAWLYYQTGRHPRMIFYFEISPNAPPNYWTLVPIMFNPSMLDNLVNWDARFLRVEERDRSTWDQLAQEAVSTAERGLTTDSFQWPKELTPLNASITPVQYKDTPNENVFQLNYSIPVNELKVNANTNDSLTISADIAVYDRYMNLKINNSEDFDLNNSKGHVYKGSFIGGTTFLLKRQDYIVSVSLMIPSENKLFGANINYKLDDFYNNLSCSSILEAYNITQRDNSVLKDRSQLDMIPNPSCSFDKSENVFIYYEIYNLAFNKNKQTDYSVNLTVQSADTSKSIWSFFAGLFGSSSPYKISIKNNYNGGLSDAPTYLAVDISELDKGNYILKLNIKDNVSGKETSASSALNIK